MQTYLLAGEILRILEGSSEDDPEVSAVTRDALRQQRRAS
jgi:hypothetical protein